MSQFYTKDQIDQIASVIGTRIKHARGESSTVSAASYDSFVMALDKAISGGEVPQEKPVEGPLEDSFVSTETSLKFLPKVSLPEGKDSAILRFRLEVDGNLRAWATDPSGNYRQPYKDIKINRTDLESFMAPVGTDRTLPYYLANHVFLSSKGAQPDLREYFKFVPSDELEPGDALEIRGHDYEELLAEYGTDPSMNVVEGNVKLTFVVIDGLPNDSIDYVEEQWGENVVVESHSYYYPEESM